MTDRRRVVTRIISSVAERELNSTIRDIIDKFGANDAFYEWEYINSSEYGTHNWHNEFVKSIIENMIDGCENVGDWELIRDFVQSEVLRELLDKNESVGLMLLYYANILGCSDTHSFDTIIENMYNKVIDSLVEEVVSRFSEIEDLIKSSI